MSRKANNYGPLDLEGECAKCHEHGATLLRSAVRTSAYYDHPDSKGTVIGVYVCVGKSENDFSVMAHVVVDLESKRALTEAPDKVTNPRSYIAVQGKLYHLFSAEHKNSGCFWEGN